MSDHWLDFIDDMRHYIAFGDLILMYLSDGKKYRIPSARFWAIAFLYVKTLKDIDRYVFLYEMILTPRECFKEMEECWRGVRNK